MSELIDHASRTWDEAAVRECCFPHDAVVILNIKIPARATDDFIAWSGEFNGTFSVRSAYRIGLQPKLQSLSLGQSSSEALGDRMMWDLVWKLDVPPKLRVFAWRVASDSLGVLQNLNRRLPKIDPICTICGHEVEDAHHALVTCTLARALRDQLRHHWTMPPDDVFYARDKEWLFALLRNSPKEQRPMIIFTLWRAWHHRNNIVHGDGKASVSASVPYLVNYLRCFSGLRNSASAPASAAWTAPDVRTVKANVDAGWDPSSKNAGVGIIIRDHLGRPLLSEWKFIPVCFSAEEAEIIACLEGLRHLVSLRHWPAVLESDCLRAVHAITTDTEEGSASWTTVLEARELLKIFRDISVAKVDRVGNGVARVLAQLGKSGFSHIVRDAVPDCVRELVTLDCNDIIPS